MAEALTSWILIIIFWMFKKSLYSECVRTHTFMYQYQNIRLKPVLFFFYVKQYIPCNIHSAFFIFIIKENLFMLLMNKFFSFLFWICALLGTQLKTIASVSTWNSTDNWRLRSQKNRILMWWEEIDITRIDVRNWNWKNSGS